MKELSLVKNVNNKQVNYGNTDIFRLIAALLVVGIHTYPLYSINTELNFIFTHILARIAVPFFLMITGFFVLPNYIQNRNTNTAPLIKFIKKTGLLYAVAALLYLPVNIYAGFPVNLTFFALIKMILFDGTFYHLWYLPASVIGVLLIFFISRKFSVKTTVCLAVFLYIIGLLGDSYYSITLNVPFLRASYNVFFRFFSFTRNGIFYAPLFLVMGALIANMKNRPNLITSITGFVISSLLLLAEGIILRYYFFQRHSSMYIMLIPCAFFLFNFLLNMKGKSYPLLRSMSMWVYIIHPMIIILIRGFARAAGLTAFLVGNSLIHYITVCIVSCIISIFISMLLQNKKKPAFPAGRAWIELDMENLRNNIKILNSRLPDNCQLMPAVKANAYGHGAVEVSRELNKNGIKAFCVATVTEGAELRENGIKGEILILGYTHPELFELLIKNNLTQTVINYDYAKTLNDYGKKINVHIKIDTGMNRLGERYENIEEILQIFKLENLEIDGIYTHLCAAESDEHEKSNFTKMQIDNFNTLLSELKEKNVKIPKTHILSSYGIFNYPDFSFDYARAGIAVYGMLSTLKDTRDYKTGLRPVLSVKTRISAVKTLLPDEPAGYGLSFKAPKNMKTAILAIGYADGVPRSISGSAGNVLINGEKAPVISLICMDQMMVDITNIENVKQGDIATVIGKSGDMEITACEIAEQTGTIANEILSRLGGRLEKYVYNSQYA